MILEQNEEKEQSDPHHQQSALLQEIKYACKSCFEEFGFQPVININVENHYHGDIENYHNYK